MAKKLTLAELNKRVKKFNEKKRIYICGGEYEVDIDLEFRPSEIDDLILTYSTAIEELKRLTNATDIQIKDTVSLLPTLVLRSFTNLPIPKNYKDIASLIIISKNLYDDGIIEEVYSHFPVDQLKKIEDKIISTGKNIGIATGELSVQYAINENKNSVSVIQDENNAELQ
ncbi:hypothetical protein [Paenibacillus tianjinensis]|uniref:Uncharacterized protein n=1 Tax=Paenibacillus tianjinensis TaxID=2810347 RepID=A0ABX7L5W2_9BACL|nr:hypothetical protein [Paenibacillus tianjinensis]QSF43267.1 hypothetical protein JRJ22_18545 [Paenibacillus tianjinensis]